ncbi:MAG: PIN domain-containing protein [Sporichthya sp.]|nr:PIN domain-containing protein [Sporichthya sp.]
MIVLDAGVLIAYLDADDAHHAVAQVLLAEAIDDECGANPLTLAEVLVVPARLGRLEAAQLVLDELEVRGPSRRILRFAWPNCGPRPGCGCRTVVFCSRPKPPEPPWPPSTIASLPRPRPATWRSVDAPRAADGQSRTGPETRTPRPCVACAPPRPPSAVSSARSHGPLGAREGPRSTAAVQRCFPDMFPNDPARESPRPIHTGQGPYPIRARGGT